MNINNWDAVLHVLFAAAIVFQIWSFNRLMRSQERLDETNDRLMAALAYRIAQLSSDEVERIKMTSFYRSLSKKLVESRVTPPDDLQPQG